MGTTNFDAVTASGTITAAQAVVTGTLTYSGNMTATGTGKTTTVKALSVQATSTLGTKIVVASAANNCVGQRTIGAASAGEGIVATTFVRSSSRIFLTPITAGYTASKRVASYVTTIASGTSFTIRLTRIQTMGTMATASGRVSWLIIDK